MLQHYAPRRVVLSAFVCFVVIVTFYRFYEPFGPVDALNNVTQDPLCYIWPDWQDSSPAHLSYKTVRTKKRPVLGDAAFIGNPDRCLLANRRLDQYLPSKDRNWDEIRWGKWKDRVLLQNFQLTFF